VLYSKAHAYTVILPVRWTLGPSGKKPVPVKKVQPLPSHKEKYIALKKMELKKVKRQALKLPSHWR
jgi:hypothetical protein